MLTQASLLRLVNLIMMFCFCVVFKFNNNNAAALLKKSWFRVINVEHDRAPL